MVILAYVFGIIPLCEIKYMPIPAINITSAILNKTLIILLASLKYKPNIKIEPNPPSDIMYCANFSSI